MASWSAKGPAKGPPASMGWCGAKGKEQQRRYQNDDKRGRGRGAAPALPSKQNHLIASAGPSLARRAPFLHRVILLLDDVIIAAAGRNDATEASAGSG